MIFEGGRDMDGDDARPPCSPRPLTGALAAINAAWLIATVIAATLVAEVATRVLLNECLLIWLGLGP